MYFLKVPDRHRQHEPGRLRLPRLCLQEQRSHPALRAKHAAGEGAIKGTLKKP